MVVYNVTMKVDWSIEADWLAWMLDYYIPRIVATGHFDKHQFVRLLEVDESDGPIYAVQYYSASLDSYNEYVKEFAPFFKKTLQAQWGDRCLAFSTLMEVLH
jgi:hypothetical protein